METVRAAVVREDVTCKMGSDSSSHKGRKWRQSELRCEKQDRAGTYSGIRKCQPWTPPTAQTVETTNLLVLCTLEERDLPPYFSCSYPGILSPPVRTQPSFILSPPGPAKPSLLPPVNNGGCHLWTSRALLSEAVGSSKPVSLVDFPS